MLRAPWPRSRVVIPPMGGIGLPHSRALRHGLGLARIPASIADGSPPQTTRGRTLRRAEGLEVADESPKRGQGTPEDPGAGLGTDVPRAGVPVRNGLHVPEGPEEGPAEAGAPVLLPDAGREGPPRVRRPGRRHPRQHVPPGAGALAGV